jgi:hypothetical protein
MDALTYLKEKIRMCDNMPTCYACPFIGYCERIEAEIPEYAIAIVNRWSNEYYLIEKKGK